VRDAAQAFVDAAEGITLDEALGAVRAAWATHRDPG
jgi:hypothetical protein